MLWDIVFEFYVKYIFGGILRNTDYSGTLGGLIYSDTHEIYRNAGTYDLTFFGFQGTFGHSFGMPLGNYLSLIATIITMVVIVVLCCLLIKKIYNMCAHVIG